MKVYIGTDIEGVAGVVTFYEQTSPGGAGYHSARKLLTEEVNAAVEALVEQGIGDILVCDGHGPGAIEYELLHPAAKLLHGRPLAPRSRRDAVVGTYDVCMMIGQHAMAGIAEGNLNHTQNSKAVDRYLLNGRPIGEIAQFALYQGALGMPLIFLSGDEAACEEAEELIPGITTAGVKQSLSRNSAISVSAVESRRRIKEGVGKAIEKQKISPLRPLVWDSPFVLEKRYFHTDTADAAASAPNVERVDAQTVRLKSDDIRDIIYR